MSIALSSLMEKIGEDNDLLIQILSSFSCEQDEDIENFLYNRSVEFEKLSKSRTYLICDKGQLTSENFYLEDLKIYGYIAIAQKILSVPDDWSNRKRKEVEWDSWHTLLSGKATCSSSIPASYLVHAVPAE